jgi:hypothetical protein
MAAGASGNENQSVDTGGERALRVRDRRHIVEHESAIGMRGLDDRIGRAQAGDDYRHAMLHAQIDVVLQADVARVHDLIDRERRDAHLRLVFPYCCKFFTYACKPGLEQLGRTRVQGREAADDAGAALRKHELRPADDEHRRADEGQTQGVTQQRRQGHAISLWSERARPRCA